VEVFGLPRLLPLKLLVISEKVTVGIKGERHRGMPHLFRGVFQSLGGCRSTFHRHSGGMKTVRRLTIVHPDAFHEVVLCVQCHKLRYSDIKNTSFSITEAPLTSGYDHGPYAGRRPIGHSRWPRPTLPGGLGKVRLDECSVNSPSFPSSLF